MALGENVILLLFQLIGACLARVAWDCALPDVTIDPDFLPFVRSYFTPRNDCQAFCLKANAKTLVFTVTLRDVSLFKRPLA